LIARLLPAIIGVAVPPGFHVRFDFHGCLFPFIEKLLLVALLQIGALPAPLGPLPLLIAYYRRTGRSRLDTGLDLQSTRHFLVVLVTYSACLDVRLDFHGSLLLSLRIRRLLLSPSSGY
jgi:hypothetical protein